MTDTAHQGFPLPAKVDGEIPIDGYRPDEIPDTVAKYPPEDVPSGDLLCVVVVKPPLSALMKTLPEAVLSGMILPALSDATVAVLKREVEYAVRGVTAPDGRYLLWFYEGGDDKS